MRTSSIQRKLLFLASLWKGIDGSLNASQLRKRNVTNTNASSELQGITYNAKRHLEKLQTFGRGNPLADKFPLQICQGDCDKDEDCDESLICFQREKNDPVPGCEGNDRSRTDYCILDPRKSIPPSAVTSVAPSIVQSTTPSITILNSLHSFGGKPPADQYPLQLCQGDCDKDADCDDGLTCYQRDRGDPIPGCSGTDSSKTDYCVQNSAISSNIRSDIFNLRLYWEQGYTWQEESTEREWCARRGSDGNAINGKCLYGKEKKSCKSNEIYTSNCEKDDNMQKFYFEAVRDGPFYDEILIVSSGNDSYPQLCLTRENNATFLLPCNAVNEKQRWYAVRGSFNSTRFEISQRISNYKGNQHFTRNLCLSQKHHPKLAEVFELEACKNSRTSQTSWWTKH